MEVLLGTLNILWKFKQKQDQWMSEQDFTQVQDLKKKLVTLN